MSHDQDFLNSVCDEILHIEDLKLASYKGNYDSFKKAEAAKIKQQQKDWEKQEKRLRELKRQGQSKSKATETVKKNKREPGARSAKKQASAAIATGTATAENKELIKRPKEYTVQISFPEVAELSRPVMGELWLQCYYIKLIVRSKFGCSSSHANFRGQPSLLSVFRKASSNLRRSWLWYWYG